MLATAGPLPGPAVEERYAFEMKWDGLRTPVSVRAGRARLWSRTGRDTTAGFPELAGLSSAVPTIPVLDGEIVAFDPAGRVSFGALQRRGLGQRAPIAWFGFDVLRLGGQDLIGLPWTSAARRWRTSAWTRRAGRSRRICPASAPRPWS